FIETAWCYFMASTVGRYCIYDPRAIDFHLSPKNRRQCIAKWQPKPAQPHGGHDDFHPGDPTLHQSYAYVADHQDRSADRRTVDTWLLQTPASPAAIFFRP